MVNYLNLSRSFILGGIVVASVNYIVEKIDPVYAGILWALPLSLLPTILFMYLDKESEKKIIHQTKEYVIYYPTLLLYVYIMYYVLHHYEHKSKNVYIALVSGLCIWILSCFIILHIFK